ncbi:forkhead box protein M1 [Pelobates fuscus]|uniref:forkhead box protein M1 n=1 Tax=Pelobates fuscus TaxID=191477 RepID=UPI002FE4D2E6
MRSSPRRPLILKRRRLNPPQHNAAIHSGMSGQGEATLMESAEQSLAQTQGVHESSLHDSTPRLAVSEPSQHGNVHRLGVIESSHQANVYPFQLSGPTEHASTDSEADNGPANFSQSAQITSVGNPTESQTQISALKPNSIQSPSGSSGEGVNILSDVRIMSHPTIPDTQLVVLPPESDVQSIIQALTARGRANGGPNKFILISGGTSFQNQTGNSKPIIKEEDFPQPVVMSPSKLQTMSKDITAGQQRGTELDISLTNIHWLGKMSSDGLSPCHVKEEPEGKENQTPDPECVKVKEEPDTLPSQKWQVSISERPPYSYMALIQFAINSTPSKRMTLKDIYTWIEDHFPYFKHVAKPGWKNSIRHNLSLHDMFVRETMANNKISYWTIHPQANRCLTLDQVFKAASPMTPLPLEPKKLIPELTKSIQNVATSSKERKMKPLLPRVSSYLIPVHFPVTQPILLPALESVCVDLGPSEAPRSSKRVKIAPKISVDPEEPPILPAALPVKEEPKEPGFPDFSSSPNLQSKKMTSSRRKQLLIAPHTEEPELVLPESSISDSGLDSEFSFLQETSVHDGTSHLTQDGTSQFTQEEEYSFKTPIKDRVLKPPSSSTPSKPTEMGSLQLWEAESPLHRDAFLDCSPVRIPQGSTLTPFKDTMRALGFGDTPFKDLPFFGSPQELFGTLSPPSPELDTMRNSTPVRAPKRCSKELQVGTPANRSLLEGLVLDTTDESLSKILLDISFSGLEEDNGSGADSVWGQLLSEFR